MWWAIFQLSTTYRHLYMYILEYTVCNGWGEVWGGGTCTVLISCDNGVPTWHDKLVDMYMEGHCTSVLTKT